MKLYKHPAPIRRIKLGNYWDEDSLGAVESGDLENIVTVEKSEDRSALEDLYEEIGDTASAPLQNRIDKLLGLK